MNTIFITGASSGMGEATARLFAERDWNVIASMRDPRKDPGLAELPGVQVVGLDVRDPDAVRAAASQVLASRPIDVVFNNAGALLAGPIEECSDEQLQDQLAVNLLGPIRVSRAFIPGFRDRGKGIIVNTTSLTALLPGPFMAVYAAAKAGLERWSFAANLELNPFGVRVKTVIPGVVNTALMSNGTLVGSAPYSEHMGRVLSTLAGPDMAKLMSEPSATAEVVWEAVTDGTDRIRYLTDALAKDAVSLMTGFAEEGTQAHLNKALFGG